MSPERGNFFFFSSYSCQEIFILNIRRQFVQMRRKLSGVTGEFLYSYLLDVVCWTTSSSQKLWLLSGLLRSMGV